MTAEISQAFSHLDRCVENAKLDELNERELHGVPAAAERELGAAYRLLHAARLVVDDADWEGEFYDDPPQAPVQRHHLLLLEAAICDATGERPDTPDGYPHGGANVSPNGFCDAGFCPCRDEQTAPQAALLDAR